MAAEGSGADASSTDEVLVRIGDDAVAEEKDMENYTWLRVVCISDTHNRCVHWLPRVLTRLAWCWCGNQHFSTLA